jgi:hypothetical protein
VSIEHSWNHLSIGTLKHDSDNKTYSLTEAKKEIPDAYEKAVELLRVRVFDKPPDLKGVRRVRDARYS